jgi:hypothetical protein
MHGRSTASAVLALTMDRGSTGIAGTEHYERVGLRSRVTECGTCRMSGR